MVELLSRLLPGNLKHRKLAVRRYLNEAGDRARRYLQRQVRTRASGDRAAAEPGPAQHMPGTTAHTRKKKSRTHDRALQKYANMTDQIVDRSAEADVVEWKTYYERLIELDNLTPEERERMREIESRDDLRDRIQDLRDEIDGNDPNSIMSVYGESTLREYMDYYEHINIVYAKWEELRGKLLFASPQEKEIIRAEMATLKAEMDQYEEDKEFGTGEFSESVDPSEVPNFGREHEDIPDDLDAQIFPSVSHEEDEEISSYYQRKYPHEYECETCDGDGYTEVECPDCGGTGYNNAEAEELSPEEQARMDMIRKKAAKQRKSQWVHRDYPVDRDSALAKVTPPGLRHVKRKWYESKQVDYKDLLFVEDDDWDAGPAKSKMDTYNHLQKTAQRMRSFDNQHPGEFDRDELEFIDDADESARSLRGYADMAGTVAGDKLDDMDKRVSRQALGDGPTPLSQEEESLLETLSDMHWRNARGDGGEPLNDEQMGMLEHLSRRKQQYVTWYWKMRKAGGEPQAPYDEEFSRLQSVIAECGGTPKKSLVKPRRKRDFLRDSGFSTICENGAVHH